MILLSAGIGLSALYRNSAEQDFDERLGVYLRALVAEVAAPSDSQPTEMGQLGEAMFELPLSGWYWQITRLDGDKPDVKTSKSLFAERLPTLSDAGVQAGVGGARRGFVTGPDNRRLRMVERLIDAGDQGRYLVQVAGSPEEIDADVASFDFSLFTTFLILAGALVASSALQVRFGLRPLRRLQEGVAAIRRGEGERIEGNFPRDIYPLASELNLLISSNREIVERARTHVGNLAHALKTPLSVIVNEVDSQAGQPGAAALAEKVREQADLMRDQVSYYLDRARAAARSSVIGTSTEVKPVVDAMVRTFTKICRDRNIAFSGSVPDDLRFRGEKQDFEELLGNLVDNAGKWANTRVQIEVRPVREPESGLTEGICVIVDDDGPGLAPDARKLVMGRGRRMDESKPGSGLGLSIVVDLAGIYGGAVDLGQSPLGGLRATLRLP